MLLNEAARGLYEEKVAFDICSEYSAKKSIQKVGLLNLGNIEIREITPGAIKKSVLELKQAPNRLGRKGLSNTTINAALKAARASCDWAIESGEEETNPFRQVKNLKSVSEHEVCFLTESEAADLIKSAKSEMGACIEHENVQKASYCLAVLLAVSTGMRRGEIFGLSWSNVDTDGCSIKVAESIKAGGEIGPPKTRSGKRVIHIGENISQELSSWALFQESLFGSKPKMVLIDKDGNIANLNMFEHWWMEFRKRAGFENIRFHDLRHTHATLLISAGVDIKTVQTRLGHSSSGITLDIYTHALPQNDINASMKLDDAVFGGNE